MEIEVIDDVYKLEDLQLYRRFKICHFHHDLKRYSQIIYIIIFTYVFSNLYILVVSSIFMKKNSPNESFGIKFSKFKSKNETFQNL